MDEKATIEYKQQNEQYTFPYHHIPHMDSWRGHSFPSMDRYLWFGFEYLGYNNRIIRMIKQRKLGSVLDVGCGDGKFLQMLSEEIMKSKHPEKMKMTGVDISAEAINLANSLNMYGGVAYRVADIAEIKDQYDCITCIETLEHIPNDSVSNVIHHIYRCLNPGGVAILCVPTTNRPKEEKHFRHYDIQEMNREIEESGVHFKKMRCEYFWRVHALENYLKLTSNRFLYIRVRLLDNLLWKCSFKANENNGSHLIMVLEK